MTRPHTNQRPQPHNRIPASIPHPNRYRASVILDSQLQTPFGTPGCFRRVDDVVDVRNAAHERDSLRTRRQVTYLDLGVVARWLPCFGLGRLERLLDLFGGEAVAEGRAG